MGVPLLTVKLQVNLIQPQEMSKNRALQTTIWLPRFFLEKWLPPHRVAFQPTLVQYTFHSVYLHAHLNQTFGKNQEFDALFRLTCHSENGITD